MKSLEPRIGETSSPSKLKKLLLYGKAFKGILRVHVNWHWKTMVFSQMKVVLM